MYWTLVFVSTLQLLHDCFAVVSFYPWGEKSHKQRNDELLAAVRNNLGLESSESSIVNGLSNSSSILVRDEAQNHWILHLASSSEQDDNILDEDEEIEEGNFDEDALKERLQNTCSVLPLDYWNYEWCHQREVHQFHIEQKEKGWIKEPNWSLGKYKRTVVVRDLTVVPSPIIKLIDYYDGGQLCHETNSGRSTEIHIQCCDGMSVPNYTPSDIYFAHESNSERSRHVSGKKVESASTIAKAVFYSIQEPSTCSYTAIICSPLLCNRRARGQQKKEAIAAHTDTLESSRSSESSHFVTVLQEILNLCLLKQEEWWTYEYCVSKGVRQIRFNIETTTSSDGGVIQRSVPVSEFLLGVPSKEIFVDEKKLIQHSKFHTNVQHLITSASNEISADMIVIHNLGMVSPLFKAQESEINSFSFEYVNGTACDLDSVNRSTTVELFCGSRNDFRLIREESTCKYRIQVDLTVLCSLPRFSPTKPNVSKISVTAETEYIREMEGAAETDNLLPNSSFDKNEEDRSKFEGAYSGNINNDEIVKWVHEPPTDERTDEYIVDKDDTTEKREPSGEVKSSVELKKELLSDLEDILSDISTDQNSSNFANVEDGLAEEKKDEL